ncbi:MAG: hypothetical protein LBN11_08395, partial [Tannerella sp.]|nr:hypothetical protein [Tannerella sp.]
DEESALKIVAEVSSNAVKRLAFIQQINAKRINEAPAAGLQAAYKRALSDIDACFINEKATLQTALELSSGASLKKFIDLQTDNILKTSKLNAKSLEELAKARGEVLQVAIKPVVWTPEEQKAAKIFPKATSLAGESGFGVLRNISRDLLARYNLLQVRNGAEIARLTKAGTSSILDIKKQIDAQFPNAESLDEITRYLELLKESKLVVF